MAGEERVRDLMDALEMSVAAAKKARDQKVREDAVDIPGCDGLDDGLTAEQAAEMHEREAEFADEEPY